MLTFQGVKPLCWRVMAQFDKLMYKKQSVLIDSIKGWHVKLKTWLSIQFILPSVRLVQVARSVSLGNYPHINGHYHEKVTVNDRMQTDYIYTLEMHTGDIAHEIFSLLKQ